MGQWNFGCCLAPMHGYVTHIHLQAKRDGVNAADFHAAAGDALHFRDHTAANQVLKGISREIPQASSQADQSHSRCHQQVLPPCAGSRPGGGLGHWVRYPSRVDASTPGMLTSLSERRVCSHETSNSLTFCWVSNSRILPETSASGTSPAPDSRSCGTNFSR